MSFVSRAAGFAPLLAVLLAACGDDGPRPPPALDGVWEGDVTLYGERQRFQLELETWGMIERDGFWGPTTVTIVLGSATVQVGDSIADYSVDGTQDGWVDLRLELENWALYRISAFYQGGDVLEGHLYDYHPRPPGEARGRIEIVLRRVGHE